MNKKGQNACWFLLVVLVPFVWVGLVEGSASNASPDMFDAHATQIRYFFQCGDMDFHFGNLVLGAAVHQGVEIGEAFWASSQILDGDAESWQTVWHSLALRVEALGNHSYERGHRISARDE